MSTTRKRAWPLALLRTQAAMEIKGFRSLRPPRGRIFQRSQHEKFLRQKDSCDSVKDWGISTVLPSVRAHFLRADELRAIISQKGFCVKGLAEHLGLDVRTLERRFGEHFRTTPKLWIMRERTVRAPSLLAEGLSNKEVAASLGYTCESNFCRDFKRYFGHPPQAFARLQEDDRIVSCFDKELSRSDKRAELPRQNGRRIL